MSTTPATTPAIGGLSLAWIAGVSNTIRLEGQALRAGAGRTIEVQSINTGQWMPLTLEGRKGGDCAFAIEADRDTVLAEIERQTGRRRSADAGSFFTAAERSRATGLLNTLGAVGGRF